MVQVAFIREQALGFQLLEAAEFEELRPLLAQVEQSQGNRDFAAHLLQGSPTDTFFKACQPTGLLLIFVCACSSLPEL